MKMYVKPCMYAEEFVSNEYISTCYVNGESKVGSCTKGGWLDTDHNKCDNTTFTIHTNGQGQITSISFKENESGQTGTASSYSGGKIKWVTTSKIVFTRDWNHEANFPNFTTTNHS